MLLPGIHWQWLEVCCLWAVLIWIVSYIIKKLFIDENMD